ncbi:MAG TPA: YIP1 family protein [Ktedonobacteraceae bacterium]|nr:YIP1 family protein [Ktedonobacteraceae bacterium]
MAWDPTQGQEQPGSGEQGQPANSGPEPNPGSGAPQNPYEGQGHPASGADPYSGYGVPQNPYGAPSPQNPYGAPSPQNPYGTPPPQNPYASPPPQNPYGAPPNQQGGYGYGYAPPQQGGYGYGYVPPQQAPRSIGQAIRELPNQYIRVLTKPSARTFAEEMGKADWAMVWIQLLIWAVAGTIVGLIAAALRLASSSLIGTSGVNYNALLALTVSGNAFAFISVPISFFILVGIQYLLAKAFKGEGNFLTQGYTTLLFEVPIYIVSYLVGLIPILGGIVGFALLIYGWVLNVFAIMAVHRLTGGKASAVVFIPIAVVFLLLILCIVALAAIFVAASRNGNPYP